MRILVIVLIITAMAGCVSVPIPPIAPDLVVIDLRRLAKLDAAIPEPEKSPDLEAQRMSIEVFRRRLQRERASMLEERAFSEADLQEQKRVAVFGGQGASLAEAPRYISDAMYAQLMTQAKLLPVEREYTELIFREVEQLIEDQGTGITSSERELQARIRSRMPADYAIIVHVIYDNAHEAAPTTVEDLPYHIPESDWRVYVEKAKEYRGWYDTYRGAIQQFNERLETLLTDAAHELRSIQEDWDQYTLRYGRYERAYEYFVGRRSRGNIDDFRRRYPKAPQHTQQYQWIGRPKRERRVDIPRNPLRVGLEDELLTRFGFATREDPDAERIYKTPSEAITEHHSTTFEYTLYKLGISVRVFNLQTGQAIWFGSAEAHDFYYTKIVEKVAQYIVNGMLGIPIPLNPACPECDDCSQCPDCPDCRDNCTRNGEYGIECGWASPLTAR